MGPVLMLVLLSGVPPMVDAAANKLGYELVGRARDEALAQPFCSEAHQARFEAARLLCAGKGARETTFVRSREHKSDETWTLRVDALEAGDAQTARDWFDALEKLARQNEGRPSGETLTLSWCPRSYLRGASGVYVVASACGALRPFCAMTRALHAALSKEAGAAATPVIVGLEGGRAVVVSAEELGRCEQGFAADSGRP